MKIKSNRQTIWICASLLTGIAAQPLAAQEVQGGSTVATEGNALEEIVVTARRREESAQTTPVSVTAFSSDQIYSKAITRVSDLTVLTPGLQTGTVGGNTPTVSLRGQRSTPVGDGLPTVLIYFADVPLPNNGSLIPTFDIGNIQVLKGPQGTLFGRNATAGAILINPAAPTGQFEGYALARMGNYNDRELEGAINIPLAGDAAALRISGQLVRRDGFTRNLGTGPDLDNLHNESFRVSLRLAPTPWLTNTTVVDYTHANETGSSSIIYGVYPNASSSSGGGARTATNSPFFNCNTSVDCDVDLQLARQKKIGPRKTYVNDNAIYNRRTLLGVVNTTLIKMGAVNFKNIFGYRSVDADYANDLDGTPLQIVKSINSYKLHQFTNEFQGSAKLFSDRLDVIAGIFYLNQSPTGLNGSGSYLLFRPDSPTPTYNETYRYNESLAAYFQAGLDLSGLLDGLKLNAGIRRTHDRQRGCLIGRPITSASIGEDSCAKTGQQIKTASSATTWTLGLDYKVNRDVFLYAVARRGYRSGGFNTPSLGGALRPYQGYQPEYVNDVEVGVKAEGRVADMPYRFNLAFYRGRYDGIQRNYTLPANFDGDGIASNDPAAGLILNSGNARLRGVEMQATLRPISDLTITASGAYSYIHYRSITIPDLFSSIPGIIPVDAINNLFPYAPRWSAGVNAEYLRRLGTAGIFAVNVDYFWTDGFVFQERPANDIAVRAPSYDLVNAQVGLRDIGGSGLDASIIVKNLFNQTYIVANGAGAAALTATSAHYGDPRMVQFALRYQF